MGTSRRTPPPQSWLTSLIERVLDFMFLNNGTGKVSLFGSKEFDVRAKAKNTAKAHPVNVDSITEMKKSLKERCAELEKECDSMYKDIHAQAALYKERRKELDRLKRVLNSIT